MALRANDRRGWLGGSDAAAVLGVSSWLTPVELWQQKVGAAANDDDVSEARRKLFKRGKLLEPVIREMVIDKLRADGHDVQLLAKNRRYRHKVYKFLSCEIDFELLLDGEHINADAKSVNHYARDKWGEIGSENIPIEYAAQFMHGLDVAPGRRGRCLVAALRSFDDVDIYWTRRDDETIEGMRAKLVEFWTEHVVPKVPPDPRKFSDVRALFPTSNKSSIEATPEILAKVEQLRKVTDQLRDLRQADEALRFEIAEFMGPHSLLTNGVRNLISWDEQDRKRFELDAFKREHPDWYQLYLKTGNSRAMRFAARR